MKTYDNQGNLISETNVIIRQEGGVVITNTVYYNNQVVVQTVSSRDAQGKVNSERAWGGKLIP